MPRPDPADNPSVSQAPPASPAARQTLSLDQVVELGRTAPPWRFLPIAHQVLAKHPDIAPVRFLAAAAFGRLALRSPALEFLDALPEPARSSPDAANLRAAIDQLPDDRIPTDNLRSTCTRNIDALARLDLDLRAEFERWSGSLGARTCVRASDGNILWKTDGAWSMPIDELSLSVQTAEQHARSGDHRPVTIEGASPPWTLLEIARRTPPDPTGLQIALRLVQADPMELLDGLALADLTDVIASGRLELFVGPDACGRLAESIRSSFDLQVCGPVFVSPSVRTRVTPDVQQTIASLHAEQVRETEACAVLVTARYAERDESYWAHRYASATDGSGPPLRVLLPSCRYSTFVRHASDDLADAFRRAGHEAQILIEPADHTRLSKLAYHRAFESFDPDLVLFINYPRHAMRECVPSDVPYVCWIQDAMPHLFDDDAGRGFGPLDFVLGHLHEALFTSHHYPLDRAIPMPVVASASKFVYRDAPTEREILYVGHQSETPDALHERLVSELAADDRMRALLEAVRPRVVEIARDAMERNVAKSLRNATAETAREVFGVEPDPRAVEHAARRYATPLADRVFRHDTLAWAARIAERRDWRLSIHGRGWDTHPTLAPYARGEVSHDDALAHLYRTSAVNLHFSTTTLAHQRVVECALAGGLPVCRLSKELLAATRHAAIADLVQHSDPPLVDESRGWPAWSVADHPRAMRFASTLQSLGLDAPEMLPISPAALEHQRRIAPLICRELDPAWLLGDLADASFWSEDSLERVIERAVERPHWRASASSYIRSRAHESLTCDSLVSRLLSKIGTTLGAGAPAAKEAA